MKECHAGAVTTRFSGVSISTSVPPTGCRADEVRTMVKSRRNRAWLGFAGSPPNRSRKDPGFEEDAISNVVGYGR